MDINTLVTSIVDYTSPALPYLLKAGDKVEEGAARQIGIDTWTVAKQIWSKLEPIVEINPFIKRAVDKVVENPSKEDAQASLRMEIEELLRKNKELSSELSKILDTNTRIDNRNGGIYGDSITITGNVAGRDMTIKN